jgi:hypothetical protein
MAAGKCDHSLSSQPRTDVSVPSEIYNETLTDELVAYSRRASASASAHAPVVAEFDMGKG